MSTAEPGLGFEYLAEHLDVGIGTAHRSVTRLRLSGLVVEQWRVNKKSLLELVVHGARYVYYVKPGTMTRGLPTADAAPPLNEQVSPAELPFVWPDPLGTVRGISVQPLHESAPRVAQENEAFYELLALTDAMRVGQARVRGLAELELRRKLAA
ncbi:MAG TPA: hypothetical protein VFN03_02130 [Trueperaceae bacterium]|nr:hypothetical protein [Trueperaceae bacterium]